MEERAMNQYATVRNQLQDRKKRLQAAIVARASVEQFVQLLGEVDKALERIDRGTYGLCDTCHDPIEADRLAADPLLRNCIDHLSPEEQRSLERDLDLAFEIQRALLPKPDLTLDGWSMAYHYAPAGPVSGDYCDILFSDDGRQEFYFFLGDVTGKGIAASILVSHLHAIFRSLLPSDLPVHQAVEKASRIFCNATLTTHFATLVCGRVSPGGELEVCNAGHPPALLLAGTSVTQVGSTGLPIGLFCNQEYSSERLTMKPGDSLILYTDGFTEADQGSGVRYGDDRLLALVRKRRAAPPRDLINACVGDVADFRSGSPPKDDMTMMVIRRE
jgi:sigma-B regulation protein RsbU (phosphoserine phosphatase)